MFSLEVRTSWLVGSLSPSLTLLGRDCHLMICMDGVVPCMLVSIPHACPARFRFVTPIFVGPVVTFRLCRKEQIPTHSVTTYRRKHNLARGGYLGKRGRTERDRTKPRKPARKQQASKQASRKKERRRLPAALLSLGEQRLHKPRHPFPRASKLVVLLGLLPAHSTIEGPHANARTRPLSGTVRRLYARRQPLRTACFWFIRAG
jgi:hypothetical protein